MLYALIENETFVRWVVLSKDYPNTSFPFPPQPSDLPDGVVIVAPMNAPPVERFQVAEKSDAPALVNGAWRVAYVIRDMTPTEKDEATANKAVAVRAERDMRLNEEIDIINPLWWETMSEEERANKRALRDNLLTVPQQAGFPWDVVWP